jgi:hypothetical protein
MIIFCETYLSDILETGKVTLAVAAQEVDSLTPESLPGFSKAGHIFWNNTTTSLTIGKRILI